MEIARAKYRSKRVLASNVTFVKLEISQDLISRNLTRYKITRNVLKRLLRFLHLVLHLSTPFSPSSPRSRIHFRGVLPREKSSRGSSDSPTLLLMERGVRIHRLRRNRGGSFIVHVQGLIFRPNARYSCSTIFAAGEGKHLANASLPLWARTERETRILVAKTRWMNSLSLSLLILHNSALELRHSRVSFILRLIGPVAGGILSSCWRWWWIFEFGESSETRICTGIGNRKKRRIVDRWLTENLRWKKNQFCMNVLRELHREL